MALFVKTLIDNYILPLVGQANPDFGPLAQILGVMATIYALGVLSNLLCARILVRVEQGTLKKLRDDMFEHMQKLPIRFFDTHQHGDIMSFIRTIQTCCVRLSLNQCLQSSRPLSLCSPLSSLCSLERTVFSRRAGIHGFRCARHPFPLPELLVVSSSNNRKLGDVNGFIEEAINGQKVIKVFTHEEAIQKQFDEENDNCLTRLLPQTRTVTLPCLRWVTSATCCTLLSLLWAIRKLGSVPKLRFSRIERADYRYAHLFPLRSRSFINPIAQISNEFTMVMLALAGARESLACSMRRLSTITVPLRSSTR